MGRISIDKIYLHRIKNIKIMAKLLALAPFVRCAVLTGSMARGKINRNSDIDILIIAKGGRIFTARAAVLFLAYLSGLKRSSDESKSHAGRFCFNYFLADDYLMIPHDRGEKIDRYCAEDYSRAVLVSGDQDLFKKFVEKNRKWMKPLLKSGNTNSKFQISDKTSSIQIPNSKSLSFIAKTKEGILKGKFGNWIEKRLKATQIHRIKKDPRAEKYPKLIVYTDREMRFHPPKTG